MRYLNDKELIAVKIVEALTPDLQENLYRALMSSIDDDISLLDLTEDITFTIHKNYRIDIEQIRLWTASIEINPNTNEA